MRLRAFLIFLIVVGAVVSSGLAWKRFYVDRNYYIYAQVPCDPLVNSCFIGEGTGASQYYKKIQKLAYLVPACNGWNEACPPLKCEPNEPQCKETYCTPEEDTPCTSGIFQ